VVLTLPWAGCDSVAGIAREVPVEVGCGLWAPVMGAHGPWALFRPKRQVRNLYELYTALFRALSIAVHIHFGFPSTNVGLSGWQLPVFTAKLQKPAAPYDQQIHMLLPPPKSTDH
jgi:hypothetical protein